VPDAAAAPEPRREPEPTPPQTSRWVIALPEGALEDISTRQVVQLFAAGRIADDVLMWKEGMDRWQRPFDIPEIKIELLARGFTPPTTPEAVRESASPQQVRRPEPQPDSKRPVDTPLPSDWQSVFDRPSLTGPVSAVDRGVAGRRYHPPSSVPPPRRGAGLGSALAERRPGTASLPPPPASTRLPSLRPVVASGHVSQTSVPPAPARFGAPAARSERPPPRRPIRAGAVPLPAAARQRQSSELDIQIDVDAPRATTEPSPLTRQGAPASLRPMLMAPSLPEVSTPRPRRRWTLWHLPLAVIVLAALAAVVVRMTHRPAVLYTAMSLALDRVKTLLPR